MTVGDILGGAIGGIATCLGLLAYMKLDEWRRQHKRVQKSSDYDEDPLEES